MRRSWLALLVLAVVATGACSADEDTAEKVGTESDSTTSTAASGPQTFKVGERVALGDWEVVVHAVQNPMPLSNEFLKPGAGKRFVGLDTEVTNRTSKAKAFSALLAFQLQDAANRTYQISVTSGAQPGPPDGELSAKGAKRGMVVFEVPDDAGSLRLVFDSSVFGTGQAVINIA